MGAIGWKGRVQVMVRFRNLCLFKLNSNPYIFGFPTACLTSTVAYQMIQIFLVVVSVI